MKLLTIVSIILVLSYAEAMEWVPGNYSKIPHNAVIAGKWQNRVLIFVGRFEMHE